MTQATVSTAPVPPLPGERVEAFRPGQYALALAAALLTVAAIGSFFLVRYPLNDFAYPIGWDAPWYVWRANAVASSGLSTIGTTRAASPLLLAMLMRATGQNAFTMVALTLGLLPALVGLAGAAMLRSALGIKAVWIPIVGALTWFAFGQLGIVGGHLDNLVNASFIVAAFGAAVTFAGTGKGAMATALLFMAGALAEWTFYAFALAVFALALTIFAWPAILARLSGHRESLGPVPRLAGAAGLSIAFTALTFLSPTREGSFGLRTFTPAFKERLRDRFFLRLGQVSRYLAFPLAALGALFVSRSPSEPARIPARRLLLCLAASWVAGTVLASFAQAAGSPVAGARLLSYLFAVPILTGAFVWWLGRTVATRPGPWGLAGGVAIVLVLAVGFGALAWGGEVGRKPWIRPQNVDDVATAGDYLTRFAPGRDVAVILQPGSLPWSVVRAALPAEVVARLTRYTGTLDEYIRDISGGATEPVGLVFKRFNPPVFDDAAQAYPNNLIASGVIALSGPILDRPLPTLRGPRARTRTLVLLTTGLLVIVLLFLAGGGWAWALLPADALTRALLAPALGAAMLCLFGLAWDRVGFSFNGRMALAPLALTVVAGWALALALARRPSSPSPR